MGGLRRTQVIAVVFILFVLLSAAAGCGSNKAVIKSLVPKEGLPGTGFKITGTYFGQTRDKSTVNVDGKKASVTLWADTSIKAIIPKDATVGSVPVTVVTGAGTSNKVTCTVIATSTESSPLPAMENFLKSQGIDTTDMSFSVVATSKTDPNWKLDKAVKTGEPTRYFVFHKDTDGWTIVDYGTTFTTDQMKVDGAPRDLKPPTQSTSTAPSPTQ